MVTVKQVPDKQVLGEVFVKAVYAVRYSSQSFGEPVAKLTSAHPLLADIHKKRNAIARLRRQLDDYCNCAGCREHDAEALAVVEAKIALEFKQLRTSMEELQHSLTRAKEQIDEAFSLLQVQALLSVCPDQ
jgi:hypothetical protein